MTPKHPWRRNQVRDAFITLLLTVPVLLIISVALGLSITHAAPSPGQVMADEHAADVCVLLDAHPTVGGLVDVMDVLVSDGLSRREAAVAVAESVAYVCPGHISLLQRVMERGVAT